MVKKILSAGLVTLLAGTAPLGTVEAAPGNAEWEKTVRAAQKEGQIAVYMWRLESLDKTVQAFQKKYPEIRVTTVALRGAELAARLMAERRAGKFLWDVCICGTTTPYRVFHDHPFLRCPSVLAPP